MCIIISAADMAMVMAEIIRHFNADFDKPAAAGGLCSCELQTYNSDAIFRRY